MFKKQGYKTRDFKDIVVYTVGVVGDNVVMLPALAALRKRYQKAKITVITNCQTWDQEGAKGVLEPSPFKDRLIILDDHPVIRNGFKFEIDNKKFQEIKCDIFLNLSPFGNRGWFGAVVREMIFAKKLGARYAIGFAISTYTRRKIFSKVQHHFIKNEPRRSEEVLKKLGLSPRYNEDLLHRDPLALQSIKKKLQKFNVDNKLIFVINPGAKFKVQCWASEKYAEVINWLKQEYDGAVVLTGIASERKIAEKIQKASGNESINLVGETSLIELIELLRLAKLCLTNDTGTMHISSMLGIPTIAIFTTRQSPGHWFPVGNNIISIFSMVDCSYCSDDYCDKRDCLNSITVDKIVKILREVLNGQKLVH